MPLNVNKEALNTITGISNGDGTFTMSFDTPTIDDIDEDPVNHPSHYEGNTSLECIDVMELAFGPRAVCHFCICNAFKYMWRYKHKNGKEDLDKARWYLDRAKTYDALNIIEDLEVLLEKAERNL